MKHKILSGMMLLAAVFTAACSSDDDYAASSSAVVTSITTGEASVSAISATAYGTVQDLSSLNASTYQVGTVFSTTADPTNGGTRQLGTIDEQGNVTSVINGLKEGTTYYYATFVTLQGKVTKYGDVKSFIATDADVATADATGISACKATLNVQASGISDILGSTSVGFKYATTEEGVANGSDLSLEESAATFSAVAQGLLPETTYYYAAYSQVGDGFILGNIQHFTTASQEMEYVDLGLSVLWAKCNIGAEEETEAGLTVGFGDQSFSNRSTSVNDYTPWSITATDEDFIYNLHIDGGSPMKSYIPSAAQVEELIAKTTQTAEEVNGVKGIRFTASNGNSIFLPLTSYRNGSEVTADGNGYYWTSTVSDVNEAYGKSLKLSGSASVELSSLAYGLSLRSVRPYAVITPEPGKLLVGDLENNGRIRLEIYNEYGATSGNSGISPSSIKFNNNMVVTFTITGINDNMKEGAATYHVAGLEYSDPTWGVGYWSGLEMGKYEAAITGDGTYSVWMETETAANGAIVFCIDIKDLAADAIDVSKIKAEIVSIKLDADVSQAVDARPVGFQNKDGKGKDGRIEIYNEYGNGGAAAPGCYNEMSFSGLCLVDFTIKGIDNNLVSGAAGNYQAELSYADASWDPSYWGGAPYGSANVTGDGRYQVYAYLPGLCEGAVVWTIELYGLWKDLVDPSKVEVTVNSITIPGKQ